jgi:hypothetical protein
MISRLHGEIPATNSLSQDTNLYGFKVVVCEYGNF